MKSETQKKTNAPSRADDAREEGLLSHKTNNNFFYKDKILKWNKFANPIDNQKHRKSIEYKIVFS